MSHVKIFDRVKDSSSTSGTGALTLDNSAPSGFQTFGSVLADGEHTWYCIQEQSGGDWEVGEGTYTSSGTTLSRDTVWASSNSGSLVSFAAGAKDVFCTVPARFAKGPMRLDVTRTNVTGTTETDTCVVAVPANAWEDGQVLTILEYVQSINNTGGNVNWTKKVYVNATSATTFNTTASTSATVRSGSYGFDLIRVGSDIYYYTSNISTANSFAPQAGTSLFPAAAKLVLLASGVTFTSDITIKLTMQLATYNATTSYYNCVGAKATLD